ncbi:MAG: acyltransferase family protein [Thermoanaerobaculia bacterium]
MAQQTPLERNRYIDFLRAASILVVVMGHWLMATAHQTDEGFALGHLLGIQPTTQWLTWIFQVMPLFFMVGGFSNSISWRSATRKGLSYSHWLSNRMQRLVGPMVPLMLFWGVTAGIAFIFGEAVTVIQIGTQMALIPLWFLAVYVLVVALTPATLGLWDRYGLGSIVAMAALAVAVDVLVFQFGIRAAGWSNYAFLWLTVHQLGYAWRDERLTGTAAPLGVAGVGLVALLWMTQMGPYSLSLVGAPNDSVSNTTPPKLPLLALAIFHSGLLLAVQRPVRRWLEGDRPWAATIIMNRVIMTVFLWHLTPLTLLIAVGYWSGGMGFSLIPGSSLWWSLRPLWMLGLIAALTPFVVIFNRFETAPPRKPASYSVLRLIVGVGFVTMGLAYLALDGVHLLGITDIRSYALAFPLLGAWLVGAWPQLRRH